MRCSSGCARAPARPPTNCSTSCCNTCNGSRAAGRGRRWILKNPGHIGQLDALSTVYPKATILHLHRDLRAVLPSYCRLIRAIYRDLFDEFDPRRIGRQTLAYWGLSSGATGCSGKPCAIG